MTYEVLEAAALDTVDCISSEGFEVDRPQYEESAFTFGFSLRAEGPQVDEAVWACIEEHYEPVNELWQRAKADEIRQHNEAVVRKVEGCLESHGADRRDTEVYELCILRGFDTEPD